MKVLNRYFMAACAALAMALLLGQGAQAQCGVSAKMIQPMGWHLQGSGLHPMLHFVDFDEGSNHEPSIVGMWHVIFTGQTMNGGAYTLPEPLDNSVVIWHRDGTEIMNSSRPAQDGNFCLGVWKQTGKREYFLNHIPWQGNDPNGNPEGGAQILEQVTLSSDGNHYSGKFSFQAYDTSGNPTLMITGTLKATRITPSTSFKELF
ncbi:MAG TPA: hypothetical protein VMF56_07110 [Acidobacteriaceae bacterium]|nr:hypothetical protein [Acidobacteriaceae bacterium]